MTPHQAALADAIDRVLPQTQCTRCGHADCRAYAVAIASNAESIDRCPPGGAEGVRRLAALTGHRVVPINAANGAEGPRHLAVIDEDECIGCTLCLKACPVDCIVGGPKAMHTVIDALCTGCELCIPACPVDCISLIDVTPGCTGWNAWSEGLAHAARNRYAFHQFRVERNAHEALPRPAVEPATDGAPEGDAADHRKRQWVAAALAKARASRLSTPGD